MQDEEQAVSQMRKMLEPFMLRRLKEDVATQLVPKQHKLALLELTESQAQLYQETVAAFRKDLLSSGADLGCSCDYTVDSHFPAVHEQGIATEYQKGDLACCSCCGLVPALYAHSFLVLGFVDLHQGQCFM